ncbi:hypothetical protein MLD38_011628 [Melastoma candidum]|uniref:Uncharacterized protein n=1 Tax=Melastoma candidum TaxID=119954 RepID=A0ACB9R3P8_9MYRT|nr:hypothetical protein MLD38_011628 [Melastoma candidum]
MKVPCCLFRNFSYVPPPPLVPVQLPSSGEAHLWYVVPDEVKDPSLLSQYMDILSPCEKENVLSFRGEGLKKAAVLARALVRTTIARYQINGHVNPGSLKFCKNKYGKPELHWEHDLGKPEHKVHFNLSHTSSLIACAIAVNSLIGIDVEDKQRKLKSNLVSFARRYFTPHEVKVLSSIQDPELQRQHFIKLWTLKESYVKALGRGFSAQPFKTFTIRIRESESGDICALNCLDNKAGITVECMDDPNRLSKNWEFATMELMGSHYAAVCMENSAAHQTDQGSYPMRLIVRKTIPFVKDELVS